MDDFSTITYALFWAEDLDQAILTAKQRQQKRQQILMKNQSILPRILARGVPLNKAADLTVRCLTNQDGPVQNPQAETDHDQSN